MDTQQLLKQYQDKIVKTNGLEIHPVTNNLFHIFQGDGWKHCSAYRKVKGRWVHVSGPALKPEQIALLK